MTLENKTWENIKAEYLRKVEKALSLVKSPRSREVLDDVRSHLDRRFAELEPDRQTWENFQTIITEMGPASDYAELLNPGAASTSRGVRRKYLLWIGVAAAVIIAAAILLPMIILERGRIVDRIDYPFVNDPDVIGTWQSVDFVTNIGDFKPGVKLFQGDLYLKEMVILEGGKTFKPWWTWTKGLIFHSGDKTASKYHIKEINGSTYMFFEWKSGDYTIRHMKPKYYVLKKRQERSKVGYIITFSAVEPFQPQTTRELLSAFNENHPPNVRTHHFRTRIRGHKLEGLICVDNKAAKEAVVNMIDKNQKLILVAVRAVTQKDLEKHYLMGQPSLKSKDTDKKASENLAADAWKLWRNRKLPEAEDMFDQAVLKDPTNANAWNGLGWSQFNQGKPLNAKVSFEKCLEIQPKHAAALNGLGWITKGQGKTDEAIVYWQKAVKAAPKATAALNGLATTYMELKKYDLAAKYYQMWLTAEPNNAQAKAGLETANTQLPVVETNQTEP